MLWNIWISLKENTVNEAEAFEERGHKLTQKKEEASASEKEELKLLITSSVKLYSLGRRNILQ